MIRVPVAMGSVLGLKVFRGFAPLSMLAEISHADVFNQDTNPLGTQREIKLEHARDAHSYTANDAQIVFFPEVVLNARDPKVVAYKASRRNSPLGELRINTKRLSSSKDRMISRVDGNHRLHFAMGDRKRKLEPIAKEVSFCLLTGLSQEQEARLFLDINSNHRGMNTSHLDNMQYQLTPQDTLNDQHFDLVVAQRLCEDPKSPFFNLVHKGGESSVSGTSARSQGLKRYINLRSLRSAIAMLIRKSKYLVVLERREPQYVLIREFWNAVKQVFPGDWSTHNNSILLKGLGVTAMAIVGADVIDRCIVAKDSSTNRLGEYLKGVSRVVDWSSKGHFGPYSGVKGADALATVIRTHVARNDNLTEMVSALQERA